MKRVYGIDVLDCPYCGERRQVIAFIEDPVVISKILTHLGIVQEFRAPPITTQTELF